ncbi:hypothetical protein DdX_19069 [Ditylenchus destructor]|uniref:Uncharacterized protein n=1 Tax=Ditylenchus destructor TaxID=166010 RepID=A0AAD4MK03_9BILA|nr:hypothetical protein DdX_19069 [Ditylenchus destructor]
MYYHLILLYITLFYQLYLLINWHMPGNTPLYDPQLLFWLGIWFTAYGCFSGLALMILSLDRIFTLMRSMIKYTKRAQNMLILLGVGVIILSYVASFLAYLLELPIDLETTVFCEHNSCVTVKYKNRPQIMAKLIICMLNLFCSALFFYLLKKSPHCKVNDRIVKVTILLDIFLEIVPAYINVILNYVFEEPAANLLGQYPPRLCILNAAICALFYSVTLLTREKQCVILGRSMTEIAEIIPKAKYSTM